MKRILISLALSVAAAGWLGVRALHAQTCTSTISSGANIVTALGSVASGGTLCLNAGSYPVVTGTVTKTSETTIRPAAGVARSSVLIAGVNASQSVYLTFYNVTWTDEVEIGTVAVGNAARHLHFDSNVFQGATTVCIYAPNNLDHDFLVTNSTFVGLTHGCTEGRLGVMGMRDQSGATHTVPVGVTISYNTFGPGGCSDGIQTADGPYGVQILYNDFVGIKQQVCTDIGDGAHVDPIQPYDSTNTVITGNYFHGNSTGLANFGCSNGITASDNIFTSDGEYTAQVYDSGKNGVYNHNTFLSPATQYMGDGNSCRTGSVGATITNSIFDAGLDTAGESGITVDHNNGGGGTNAIVGTVTYMGGSSPSTWAGFQLTSGSVGHLAGSDGLDIGARYFGAVASGTPSVSVVRLRIK